MVCKISDLQEFTKEVKVDRKTQTEANSRNTKVDRKIQTAGRGIVPAGTIKLTAKSKQKQTAKLTAKSKQKRTAGRAIVPTLLSRKL
jgi:hypothetical protein